MNSAIQWTLILSLGAALVACGDGSAERASVEAPPPDDSAAQVNIVPTITYSSLPDPPRAGDNAVSVLVVDTDGKSIADATVSATYFMPAMPTMSMPEMRDRFDLASQGEGKYAGTVRLSMGGTWIVTVTATRGEETVARKVFNIVAKE